MNSLVADYTAVVSKGRLPIAYKGILSFLSGLGLYLRERHPDHVLSALYPGYMDMSYFAFTPMCLKDKNLKIALVYLHKEGRFEAWLSGGNRKAQAKHIALLAGRELGPYRLSRAVAGVDSIIETVLQHQPDFDNPRELMEGLEQKLTAFVRDVIALIDA